MNPHRVVIFSLTLALLLVPTAPSRASTIPEVTTRVVALTGQTADEEFRFGEFVSYSRFERFGTPFLNNKGDTLFTATLTGTRFDSRDNAGLYIQDDLDGLKSVARKGTIASDGNGEFSRFELRDLNDVGQAAFWVRFTDTQGSFRDDTGLYLYDDLFGVKQVARRGSAIPDGSAIITSVFGNPTLNNAGRIAFRSEIASTDFIPRLNEALFTYDNLVGLQQLARTGDATPDGNGSFGGFSEPALNDAGQVAFFSVLTGTSGGNGDNRGIYVYDDPLVVRQVARAGDAVPDGNGRLSSFEAPILNDSGQIAFFARLTGTSGSRDNLGVFLYDDLNGLKQVARAGAPAPDDNGRFSTFTGLPALNDLGQVAFTGTLTGTRGGGSDNSGIFRGDINSSPVQIAREGDAVPDGNGMFSSFGAAALNDAGQVAFRGLLSGTSDGDGEGIYFYDDSVGLIQVARTGDAFLGSTISDLSFLPRGFNLRSDLSDLSGQGQIAYEFELADGREGIAITSFVVPEPTTLLLGLLAGGALAVRTRFRRNTRC